MLKKLFISLFFFVSCLNYSQPSVNYLNTSDEKQNTTRIAAYNNLKIALYCAAIGATVGVIYLLRQGGTFSLFNFTTESFEFGMIMEITIGEMDKQIDLKQHFTTLV